MLFITSFNFKVRRHCCCNHTVKTFIIERIVRSKMDIAKLDLYCIQIFIYNISNVVKAGDVSEKPSITLIQCLVMISFIQHKIIL